YYEYAFDKAGQLTREVLNGRETTFAHDARGQLTGVDLPDRPDEAYSWDANGNPTGAYTTYTYDYRNRLTAVTVYSTAGVAEHAYTATFDVFDRRIGFAADGAVTWTVYDGETAWADFDAAGGVVARYLPGIHDDELWARWRPADGTGWYLQDRMFSVRDVTDADGVVVNHTEYDGFGAVVSETDPAAGDRFKYTGREYDTSTGLYHYRARGYDPASRTFLQEDPLGLAAGDTNTYRYVFNRPDTLRDPSGMLAVGEYGVMVGKIAGVIPTVDDWVCMSDQTVRITYSLGGDFWGADETVGVVIAPYGLPVPVIDQMLFCVESCADLGVTAYANGIFAIMGLSLEWFARTSADRRSHLTELEYAEPVEAMGLWKLRVSASCVEKKLGGIGGAGARQEAVVAGAAGAVACPAAAAGRAGGWENGRKRRSDPKSGGNPTGAPSPRKPTASFGLSVPQSRAAVPAARRAKRTSFLRRPAPIAAASHSGVTGLRTTGRVAGRHTHISVNDVEPCRRDVNQNRMPGGVGFVLVEDLLAGEWTD
ncbi:MAG: RHS repeat domain-containing protein, partial [Fimbriiglobus sp.]